MNSNENCDYKNMDEFLKCIYNPTAITIDVKKTLFGVYYQGGNCVQKLMRMIQQYRSEAV